MPRKKRQLIVEGFGGEKYYANTPARIVEKMRASAWGGDTSAGIKGYMRQVAKRVKDWNGKSIRTERAAEFLSDLDKAGLIRVVKEQTEKET